MHPAARKESLRSNAASLGTENAKSRVIDHLHDPHQQQDTHHTKRHKKELLSQIPHQVKALNTIADEVVCPITQHLIVDPVIACDGKVYERASINKWLKKHDRSPMTGNQMEDTLTPALHVRSIIEALIASNAIDADMVKAWLESSEKESKRKALLARAKHPFPEIDAVVDLALFYHAEGQAKECKNWIINGARFRDPYCMAQLALYLFKKAADNSTKRYQNCTMAMCYMVQAAEAGHILSMFRLAQMFYSGHVWIVTGKVIASFTTDDAQALHWLSKLVAKLIDCGLDILGTWDPCAIGTGMQRTEVVTGLNIGDLDADWIRIWFKNARSNSQMLIDSSGSESESESEEEVEMDEEDEENESEPGESEPEEGEDESEPEDEEDESEPEDEE